MTRRRDIPYADVVRTVWDEFAAASTDGEVESEAIVAAVAARITIDLDSAKHAAASRAFHYVDDERTKDISAQLPLFDDETRFLVIGDGKRAQETRAKYAHVMAARQLKVENLKLAQASLDRYDARYFPILEYLARGMTCQEAGEAYLRDHPDELAAD